MNAYQQRQAARKAKRKGYYEARKPVRKQQRADQIMDALREFEVAFKECEGVALPNARINFVEATNQLFFNGKPISLSKLREFTQTLYALKHQKELDCPEDVG